jgi:hypothetical protein
MWEISSTEKSPLAIYIYAYLGYDISTVAKDKRRSQPTLIEVPCAGRGRTQRVRPSKIVPCDGSTCSLGRCKKNPDFEIPQAPEGYVCSVKMNAAGAFRGWEIRPATLGEKRSLERARAIRDAAIMQLLRRN